VKKKTRIKVVWCGGRAWAFYEHTADAYEQCRGLKMVGFADAHIDWINSSF